MERFKRELSEKEESSRQELSDTEIKSRKELSKVCESWDNRAQQWDTEKRELEEMLMVKEIQCLTKEIIQLQVR